MKIAFDCERMKYPHTGLFEYCQQLGLALKASANVEDEVKYYLRDGDQHYFDPSSKFFVRNVFHKVLFPNYREVDLWHITHQTSVYVPPSAKIKKILTIHDLNFLYEEKPAWKQKNYLKRHQQNIDRADHIVAISNFTKNDILKYLKTDDKPISVIYNGCAAAPLAPLANPAYQPENSFLFALGTVNEKKNFHVLVPLLLKNDFELIIAGRVDKAYEAKIMEQAVRYKVANRVKVIGPVTEQDKLWFYKNCQAFLFPSLAEGFGIPPIEAMRFGKPTFLSNATSLPEIGGDLAYYFGSYDADDMQQVFEEGINDYNLRKPSAAIIAHANQFNWDTSAAAYWKVYRDTLGK